jgi:hypothetical protein
MKKRIFFVIPYLLLGILIMLSGCREEDTSGDLPSVNTVALYRICTTSAYSGGSFTSEGESSVVQKGVCWSNSPTPTTTNSKTVDGPGTTSYFSRITGLIPNTKYYVRAYAINSSGISYGNEYSFTTSLNDSAPCTPQSNSIWFYSQQITFNTTAGTSSLFYGQYGLVGKYSNLRLRIEFPSVPDAGKYVTAIGSELIEEGQCVVNGTFGSPYGEYVEAIAGDTVYVIKTGEGKYSMTFCNLNFQSASFNFITDGNLTTE